jgi:hypothetical protein
MLDIPTIETLRLPAVVTGRVVARLRSMQGVTDRFRRPRARYGPP